MRRKSFLSGFRATELDNLLQRKEERTSTPTNSWILWRQELCLCLMPAAVPNRAGALKVFNGSMNVFCLFIKPRNWHLLNPDYAWHCLGTLHRHFSPISKEKVEAQRSYTTSSGPYRWQGIEPGSDPRIWIQHIILNHCAKLISDDELLRQEDLSNSSLHPSQDTQDLNNKYGVNEWMNKWMSVTRHSIHAWLQILSITDTNYFLQSLDINQLVCSFWIQIKF